MKEGTLSVEARAELSAIVRSLNELLRGRMGSPSVSEGRQSVQPVRGACQASKPGHGTPQAGRPLSVIRRGPEAGPPVAAQNVRAPVEAPDAAALEALGLEVAKCSRCSLHRTRTNVVFGSGRGSTRILFVGEAPGRDEDEQGLPFVGRAGQLLTKIIKAIEFDREDVYIANVLKCRPPDNRNPLPEEVARCRPFLLRQIESLKPKVICTLGVFATQVLLDTKSPLTVLRGQVHRINGLTIVSTYHPAACLRYPRLKEAVWEDVKLLRKEYLS